MTTTSLQPREVVRHELVRRTLTVSAIRDIGPSMRRITLVGPDLAGFSSDGPEDHIKAFFPDPTPTDAAAVSMRDFTPRAFRADAASGPELDIDFVLHGDSAPATGWAARVAIGDSLSIGGPRGSRLAPAGADSAILLADPTALPALARWIEILPDGTPVTAIVAASDDSFRAYAADIDAKGTPVTWIWIDEADDAARATAQLEAIRSATIGTSTLVWAAGESTALVDVRRYLRRELGLDKDQVFVDGYWRRGTANLDHHAPLDPTDPD